MIKPYAGITEDMQSPSDRNGRKTKMKLFLISQIQNDDYDTYDSAVVCAPDEETARHMDPSSGKPVEDWEKKPSVWCSGPDHVMVRYLGEARAYYRGKKVKVYPGVVCASFNAG